MLRILDIVVYFEKRNGVFSVIAQETQHAMAGHKQIQFKKIRAADEIIPIRITR